MYYTEPILFSSVIKDIPARKLADNILQQGDNIIFDSSMITPRYGIANMCSASLGDQITGISLYKRLRADERFIVVMINKDIYVYNPSRGVYLLKTRNYHTGTVSTSGTGYRTVTLSGGTWLTTWDQVNLYEISFDSTLPENCTTWYNVASITSGTTLALSENGVSKSGSTYCLRLCYAGDADNTWHSCYPYSPITDDRIILCTNGIDPIQVWDSTGTFADFTGYADVVKFVGFFGSVGYEHIIYANTFDSGTQTSFPQTFAWSDGGALTGSNYAELLDDVDEITGVVPLTNRLLIYKSGSISVADVNTSGGNTDAFFITQNIYDFGTPSINTVCNTGNAHILFTGNDIRKIDGHNFEVISTGNSQYIVNNINKEYMHRSFAFILPEQNLYCLFLPFRPSEYCNICIVHNYSTGAWSYWNMKDINGDVMAPLCKGKYSRTYSPTWDDLIMTPTGTRTSGSAVITNVSTTADIVVGMHIRGTGIATGATVLSFVANTSITMSANATANSTVDDLRIGFYPSQMPHRWSDLIVDERYTRMLFRDADGYIYEYSIDFLNDNDYTIDSIITTKDYDLNKAGYDFRLLECTLMMHLNDLFTGNATVDVRASVDFGRNWSAWITLPLDGNVTYMEKKANFNMVGKQVRYQVRTSTPMVFETMTIGFNANYKSMKFDE